jgi:hypothetical protein
MILTKNDDEVKWYWSDGKMHTISVSIDESHLSLKDHYEKCHKLAKDQEELCKKIYFLGVSLTGTDEGAWGFLMGWLSRSIKKDSNWVINHIEDEVPEEEVREHLAAVMEEGAKLLREGKDGKKPKAMSPLLGGSDGTEMFA